MAELLSGFHPAWAPSSGSAVDHGAVSIKVASESGSPLCDIALSLETVEEDAGDVVSEYLASCTGQEHAYNSRAW
jgi:hypothetical protein